MYFHDNQFNEKEKNHGEGVSWELKFMKICKNQISRKPIFIRKLLSVSSNITLHLREDWWGSEKNMQRIPIFLKGKGNCVLQFDCVIKITLWHQWLTMVDNSWYLAWPWLKFWSTMVDNFWQWLTIFDNGRQLSTMVVNCWQWLTLL